MKKRPDAPPDRLFNPHHFPYTFLNKKNYQFHIRWECSKRCPGFKADNSMTIQICIDFLFGHLDFEIFLSIIVYQARQIINNFINH